MQTSARYLRQGFTLIEMVVVVGIMGILLMVGVASYGRLNERAKVEQAAVSIATQLRTWQKQVESGIGNSECGGGIFGGLSVSRPDGIGDEIQAAVVCGGSVMETKRTFEITNDCLVEEFDPFVIKPLGLGVLPATDIFVVNPKISTTAYTVSVSLSGGIDVYKTTP